MRQGGTEMTITSHYACCSSPAAIQTERFPRLASCTRGARHPCGRNPGHRGSDAVAEVLRARKRRGSTCWLGTAQANEMVPEACRWP